MLMLWEAWQKDFGPKPPAPTPQTQVPASVPAPAAKPGAPPAAAAPAMQRAPDGSVPGAAAPAAKGETITVRTDLIVVEIDTLGATLKRVELLKHKEAKDSAKNLVLLGPEHRYEAQSGLTGNADRITAVCGSQAWSLVLGDGQDTLDVRFTAQGADGSR